MKLFQKLFGERTPEPTPQPEPVISRGYGSLQGLGKRSSQQDWFLALNVREPEAAEKQGILLLVADGMGGMQGGAEASETTARFIEGGFRSMDMQGNIAGQLLSAVLGANEAVYSKLGGEGGSTLVACVIYRDQLYFASVGDSGLYLLRGDQLSRLNREQNIENLEYLMSIRRGSADPEGENLGLSKAALSHFVGMPQLDEVDFLRRPLRLQPGDVLLLCSDGVDGSLPDDVLTACLKAGSPEECCMQLERQIAAADLPHQDNYTGLVFRIGG